MGGMLLHIYIDFDEPRHIDVKTFLINHGTFRSQQRAQGIDAYEIAISRWVFPVSGLC